VGADPPSGSRGDTWFASVTSRGLPAGSSRSVTSPPPATFQDRAAHLDQARDDILASTSFPREVWPQSERRPAGTAEQRDPPPRRLGRHLPGRDAIIGQYSSRRSLCCMVLGYLPLAGQVQPRSAQHPPAISRPGGHATRRGLVGRVRRATACRAAVGRRAIRVPGDAGRRSGGYRHLRPGRDQGFPPSAD
jgi:hypothetical protein